MRVGRDDARVACGSTAERERAAAELASRQHGVVTRQQLLLLGLTRDQIDNRLKSARIRALYRGVYLLGAVAPTHAREMAAVLACGVGAVLSHRSAAVLWRLLTPGAAEVTPNVIVPGRNPHNRDGIRVHRVKRLDPRDVRRYAGIPVTTPARTLLDLAAEEPDAVVEKAFAEAQVRRIVTPSKLSSLLDRHPGRSGVPALSRLLDRRPALTRSEAERRFLALVRQARLPQPDTNVRLGGIEVDFLWRQSQLVVEVDGYAFHSSRGAFERDRRRDAELQSAGFRVIRVTWRQIVEEPEAMLVRIAAALARARP
jgi:very-short-patch-repair endonuclease